MYQTVAESWLGKAREETETGKFREAIAACHRAFHFAVSGAEMKVAVHSLVDEVNAWQHLYKTAGNPEYAIRALSVAKLMEQLQAQYRIHDEWAVVYYRLGTAYFLNQQYSRAIESLRQALDWFDKSGHWPAEKEDWRVHYGESFVLMGEKRIGLDIMFQALDELNRWSTEETVDERTSFLLNVWITGAHHRLSCLLQHDDPKKAKWHLEKARAIIDSDNRLVVRKREQEELEAR